MKKETVIFILGMVCVLVPFLGVPTLWKTYLLIGIGAWLIWLGYRLRRAAFLREIDQGDGEQSTDSFAEYHNKDQLKLTDV